MNRRVFLSLLFTFISIFLFHNVTTTAKELAELNTETVTVCPTPHTTHDCWGTLTVRGQVNVLDCVNTEKNNVQCLIRYYGVQGWIAGKYIKPNASKPKDLSLIDEKPGAEKVSNTSQDALYLAKANHPDGYPLNIRSSPHFNHNILGTMPGDATGVQVYQCRFVSNDDGKNREWCKIKYLKLEGWTSAKYLKRTAKNTQVSGLEDFAKSFTTENLDKPEEETKREDKKENDNTIVRRGNRRNHCCYELVVSDNSSDSMTHNGLTLNPENTWGHIVYEAVLPSFWAGSISVVRESGTGNMDIEVGTSVSEGGDGKAQIGGLIGESTRPGGDMDVVMIPPNIEDKRIYIHIYTANHEKWDGRIYFRRDHIPSTFGRAFLMSSGQFIVESAIESLLGVEKDGPSIGKDIAERAVTIGLAAISNDTLLNGGIDVAVGEVQSQLSAQFPGSDNRYVILIATNTIKEILKSLMRPMILHQEDKLF